MSQDDIERIIKAMESRGASITVADPRVSSMQNAVLAGVGSCLVAVMGWGVLSINRLNTTMERVVVQNEYMGRQIDTQEHRIYTLEQRR
jgi:hypothetical protein